ncbi:MAG: T9SS type A sorting domain-containing protein [Bacteroidota bacterium]
MLQKRSSDATGRVFRSRKGAYYAQIFPTFRYFCGFIIVFCLAQVAQAQVTWSTVGEFRVGYELSTSAATLAAGEQFAIKLYADVEDSSAAIGVLFDVVLDPSVSVESAALSIPSSSWLGTSDDLATGYQHVARSEEVEVHRTDETTASGEGELISLHCKVGANPIAARQVVQSGGGNIIMIENLDLRLAAPGATSTGENPGETAPPEAASSPTAVPTAGIRPRLYPNPTTAWIAFAGIGTEPTQVSVYDGAGRCQMQLVVRGNERVPVAHLPAGTYLVRLRGTQSGTRQSGRFTVQ